uniref:Beta-defensin-like domain-containing protein n=1 Tax=Cyanoderma ruficeps TaxID=181631 RepID=A0A8C3R1J0_9PASS
MKILFLLFPLILLLVQGAAGSELHCRHRRGYCSLGICVPPARPIGMCTGQTLCCKG